MRALKPQYGNRDGAIMKAERHGRASERSEVWVRGNPRPLVVLAVAFALGIAAVAGTGVALGSRGLVLAAVVAGVVAIPPVVALAFAAALPRIERRGGALRLRVAPTRAYDVPLEAVECFFHGAHAIGRPVEPCTGEASEHEEHAPEHGRRRGTIAVRIAERARDWHERPTFRPWAGWKRGSIVLDGLWYEPLSMERFGELAQRLVEAKRSLRAGEETR